MSRKPATGTTIPGSETTTFAVESPDTDSTVEPLIRGSTLDPHSLDDLKEPGLKRIAWEQHGTARDVASYGRPGDMSFISKTLAERDSTGGSMQDATPLNSSERYHEPYLVGQDSQPESQILIPLPSVVILPGDPRVLARRSIMDEGLPGHRDKRQRLNDSYIEQYQSVPDQASQDELQLRTNNGIFQYASEMRKEGPNTKGKYGDDAPQTPSTSSPIQKGICIDTFGKLSRPLDQSVTKSRRLSINSLLSSSAKTKVKQLAPPFEFDRRDVSKNAESTAATDIFYGIDRGLHDLDVPRNDDANVLSLTSPAFDSKDVGNSGEMIESDGIVEFGFGIFGNNASSSDIGYYVQPVPVTIPKNLEPLPPILLENSMNLMYFHHFLNHTARILVPHDCSENPFKNILPQSELYFSSDMMVLVDLHQWLYRT